uniref:Uncharacterized protein n=1 Tax=Skeletonema marinoi TaxID=267567 RepID=A0A7S2KDF9_9STRA
MHEYDFEDANTQGGDDNVVKEPPHGWQTFGFLQIRAHFSCNAFDYVLFKPPSMKEWQMILDAYNKEVDSSYKFDEIGHQPQQLQQLKSLGVSLHLHIDK